MPGYQRAQQNWRRTSNLAARVSLNRPPAGHASTPAHGASAMAFLNASVALAAANRLSVTAPPPPPAFGAVHYGVHHHPLHLSHGVPVTAPAQQGGVWPRLLPNVRSPATISGTVRASRGDHLLGPAAGAALPDQFPSFEAMMSEVRVSTPTGRSRQRSRSMTSSPSALLEEYKTRWTCKVT